MSTTLQNSREDDVQFDLETIVCPICGDADYVLQYRKADHRFDISDHLFDVVICSNCKVGYVNPRPTLNTIGLFYPAAFYDDSSRSAMTRHNARRYPLQAKYLEHLSAGARVLDVGCATGSFVDYLVANYDFDCLGTDLFEPENKHADPSRLSFGYLPDMRYPSSSFDAVCSWAVFEHLHYPTEYFREVRRILRPGGRFVFLVPHFNSIRSRYAYMEDVPRHLIFFNRNALRIIAQTMDFRLERIECRNDIYQGGGWLYFRNLYLLWRTRDFHSFRKNYPLSKFDSVAKLALSCLGVILINPAMERALGIGGTIVVTMSK